MCVFTSVCVFAVVSIWPRVLLQTSPNRTDFGIGGEKHTRIHTQTMAHSSKHGGSAGGAGGNPTAAAASNNDELLPEVSDRPGATRSLHHLAQAWRRYVHHAFVFYMRIYCINTDKTQHRIHQSRCRQPGLSNASNACVCVCALTLDRLPAKYSFAIVFYN